MYRANRFGVQPVAVKVLREESSKQIENFKREIDMLRGLRDNNIVLFLGACKKDGKLMLVTEFMPQGDLWNALSHANANKFLWYNRCSPCAPTGLFCLVLPSSMGHSPHSRARCITVWFTENPAVAASSAPLPRCGLES